MQKIPVDTNKGIGNWHLFLIFVVVPLVRAAKSSVIRCPYMAQHYTDAPPAA
jgi:hypothetical protein